MKSLYVNVDGNSSLMPFLDSVCKKGTVRAVDLYPFVDGYAGTRVTDVLFNIFCQYSNTDTAFWSSYEDKYLQKEEDGVAVDYTAEYGSLYKLNREYGIEPFGVFIDRCRQHGLRPWLSVRMNDCHDPRERTSFLRSDFYYEAKRSGWLLGEPYGHSMCYDYQHAAVRERMLGYIEEQLQRYDVDGLELDFMREITCFRYADGKTEEFTAIMNDFIRAVRRRTQAAAQRYGHPVRLAVRLMRSMAQSRYFGFDAAAWAAEGLVDLIIPTPRWARSDSGIPVAAWKAALPGVEIAPGLETLAEAHPIRVGCQTFMSAALARGHAAAFLADGADSIYLFNYFDATGINAPWDDIPGGETRRNLEVYRTCGGTEELFRHPLRFAVIPQDDHVPGLPDSEHELPLTLGEAPQSISIRTGSIPAGKNVFLLLGFAEGTPAGANICFNGAPCTGFESADTAALPGMTAQPPVRTAPPEGFFLCGVSLPETAVQTVTLTGSGRIAWCELIVV